MFFTINIKKFKIPVAICLILAMCTAYITVLSGIGKSVSVYTSDTNIVRVSSYRDMQKYFKSFGWEVERLPKNIENIYLPTELSGEYENFEKIQNLQGLSIKSYLGKKVKKYSFVIKNHPNGFDDIIVGNLLVYKHNVIAGYIKSESDKIVMASLNKNQ